MFNAKAQRVITAALPALGLVLVAGLGTGCQAKQTLRATHAPTYSYIHDPEALAEVELWPEMTTVSGYEVISVSERE